LNRQDQDHRTLTTMDVLETEEYRHQCEVRAVLAWRTADRDSALKYLSVVRQKRGHEAADQLEADCKSQWGLGNRGKKGDWRG
jgi:hypothetical protein